MDDPGPPSSAGEPTYPQYPQYPPSSAYPGYGYAGYPQPEEPTRSVTGLGIATQVLLVVQMLAAFGLLFPVLHERDLIHRVQSGGTITLEEAQRADDRVGAMSSIVLVLYLITGIVWIIWFYRARKNADAFGSVFQRFGAGWAIGGWFCPIVNLWFPYVIAKDILDDTERDPNAGWPQRPFRPLLLLWWLAYVALFVMGFVESAASDSKTPDGLHHYTNVVIAATIARLVAAALALVVVRQITAAQTKRINTPSATPAWGGRGAHR
jgi:hypothetical protein